VFILSEFGRLSIAALVVTGVALPAAPVTAAKTICVGLVVDARSLDGPMSAKCTTVPDGSSGYDVLRAGGHTVGFRNDGIICTIDNRPSDGCAAVDAMHYWAYFHREPGSSSWSYSNEGATTYKPENEETEGWVWRDGDMAKPENVPYSTICPQTASPTPKPTPQPTSKSPVTHAVAAPSTTPTGVTTKKPSRAVHHTKRHVRHRGPTATAGPTTTASSSPPVTVAAVNSQSSDDSGPPWGVIVGAVVVVGLGGAATLRWRRRGVE
jgi:MYXO-CTERM domain-containing protein